jgi:hypothetical protein
MIDRSPGNRWSVSLIFSFELNARIVRFDDSDQLVIQFLAITIGSVSVISGRPIAIRPCRMDPGRTLEWMMIFGKNSTRPTLRFERHTFFMTSALRMGRKCSTVSLQAMRNYKIYFTNGIFDSILHCGDALETRRTFTWNTLQITKLERLWINSSVREPRINYERLNESNNPSAPPFSIAECYFQAAVSSHYRHIFEASTQKGYFDNNCFRLNLKKMKVTRDESNNRVFWFWNGWCYSTRARHEWHDPLSGC